MNELPQQYLPPQYPWLALILGLGVVGLFCAYYLARYVLAQGTGTDKMRSISDAIKQGANAFMKRQYKTIFIIAIVFALGIAALYLVTNKPMLALHTGIAFITGAFSSGVAGIIGMSISVRSNIRTAAASTKSISQAVKIALRGGAVSGVTIVSMSVLGVACIYWLFGAIPKETPYVIVGYGFGASFIALFAQLGGGIYTKAADVGADLVGKVEAGIPEDDPRNPAVIADLVGDNVGDCAGRGADLFESTAAENIGAMILGVALYPVFGIHGILFPLVARAFGLIACIVGIFFVHGPEEEDPMKTLNRGYYVAIIGSVIGFFIAVMLLLKGNMHFFFCGLIGIATSLAFVYITQYYTEAKYRPVKEIIEASKTGPATNIIAGLAVGLENPGIPVIVLSMALYFSYKLGMLAGVGDAGGLYGTAVATMGMLATAAYILAMDTFGPIVDNAGGITEMSGQAEEIRKKTDRLDAVGNTTKALTKGYAIGSAALASFLLFSAYKEEASKYLVEKGLPKLTTIDIGNIGVFVGAFLGAMLVFVFSAFAIRAVGRTAQYIIENVRTQFKDPGILAGTVKPDYAQCVDITTKGALKNMILPGCTAVIFPIVVGVLLKAEATAAMLMVGTITGVLLATLMNNAGGAWDNAKKFMEYAAGGKGTLMHKTTVVGDTVGDPLKDCAGPSLHILVKLLSTITLVLAPLFI
jgi:K(+)-stimulated pyrophosphate-energized sodium pump